jgi:putative oxidoreductase
MQWASYLLSILRIAAGLLFMQHGGEKLWGFAGGKIDHNFPQLHALAGPIELIGGLLLVLGLFTRTTAFILCGEMAVAYFGTWAPRGFFPISNGGEEAVLFCYLYLWMVTSGAAPWSLDAVLEKRHKLSADRGMTGAALRTWSVKQTVSSWEPYARSILRIMLAFVFSLHGYRLVYGVFPQLARRAGVGRMPLDGLPQFTGYIAIVGGALLFLGLLSKPVSLLLALQSLAACLIVAVPRSPIPLRAGADEVLLYFFVFLYLAAEGGGIWSLDFMIQKLRSQTPAPRFAQS